MAFEQFLNQKEPPGGRNKWRAITYTFSLSLHGALLLGMLVRGFWHVEELEPKGVPVTMMALRVPPPPPAPPERKMAPKPKVAAVVPRREKVLVQPVVAREVPPAAKEEEPAEPSDDTGVAGGQEGGVAGGVTNATVAPPPPPPPARPQVEAPPIMLAPNIGSGQRLSDLNDPRYRPTLPPTLNRGGIIIWGMFRICVTETGRVKDVKILKSADILVDNTWSEIIHRWEYRPYSIAGRPVPFCHAARIEVRSQL
jgi:hypothetical protein